ncbi:MAG: NAD(+)/NADH kinase, partial [Armatimonadota bacterium]
MRVALVVNLHRSDAIEAAQWAARWLLEHGPIEVVAEDEVAQRINVQPATNEQISHSDLVIAFGGDGTIIRAAHICSEVGTPILGVHFGRFGFVTQCSPEEIGSALSAFLDGEHSVEKRMMLKTDLIRGERVVATIHTLNESVLQRIVTDRMLTFEVNVNGNHLTSYPADGI